MFNDLLLDEKTGEVLINKIKEPIVGKYIATTYQEPWKSYKKKYGNKELVFNDIAYCTKSGLKKEDLMLNSKDKIVSRKKNEMARERFLKKKKEADMKEVDTKVLKLAKSEVSEFLPKKKKSILRFKNEVDIKPVSDSSYSSSNEPDIDYHNKYIDVKT